MELKIARTTNAATPRVQVAPLIHPTENVSDRTAAEVFVVVGCSQKARTLPLNLFPIKYQNVFGLLFTGLAYSHRQGL